jgi:signal transduction histidine kinase
MKKTATAAKNFVVAHKTALAVTATAVTCLALNKRAMRMHDEFLKEKGLFEEFYAPEEN